jgi:hypothetical protein
MTKEIFEDNITAEKSVSYKEIVKDYYHEFNIMKTHDKDNIKRIKEIKLYPGK